MNCVHKNAKADCVSMTLIAPHVTTETATSGRLAAQTCQTFLQYITLDRRYRIAAFTIEVLNQ